MIIQLLKRGVVPFVNYLGLRLFIARLAPQSGHPGIPGIKNVHSRIPGNEKRGLGMHSLDYLQSTTLVLRSQPGYTLRIPPESTKLTGHFGPKTLRIQKLGPKCLRYEVSGYLNK